MVLQFLCVVTLHVSAYMAIFRCVGYFPLFIFEEKTKYAHVKIEIKENTTRTNTN
jgi:hypothetical protein